MARWLVFLAAVALSSCGGGGSASDAGPDAAAEDASRDADAGPVATCEATEADFPPPRAGLCVAEIVDDTASLPVGDDADGGFIVPGARRVTKQGTQVELPGFPMRVVPIPNSRFVLVTDGGVREEQLSIVDLESASVVDRRVFNGQTQALFLGIVTSPTGDKIWASGGGTGLIWAYDFDTTTGALSDAPAIAIEPTTNEGYVAGMRLLADGHTLAMTLLFGDAVVLYDTTTDRELARIPLEEESYPYDIVVTPDDSTAFVSSWSTSSVIPVDLVARRVGTPIPVGKNPEGLALSPDGATLVVANSDSDSSSVIDVPSRSLKDTLWVHSETGTRGAAPAAGAFDAAGRLYVVNSGDNAVDVFEPGGTSFVRVGRVPSMWYPTDVAALDDGRVLVLNGKYRGTGPNLDPSRASITARVGGSLQIMAATDLTDANLAAWELEVSTNNDRATRFGAVRCPDGAGYDFPIPRPGEGPSSVIEHVVLVVRENKTYDSYLGNLTDASGAPHGNGDPSLTLVPPEETNQVFPNTQELARQFSIGDNYYSLAEQSVQGHFWTTHGRTTDFVERSWLTTWGRSYWRIPPQGIFDPLGYPEEGSVFDWLVENDVALDNFGEIVASRAAFPNGRYPGLVYTLAIRDVQKVAFLEREWRQRCRLKTFSYVVLPDDHTYGGKAGRPTPRSMMADNDQAVGDLVDALSHSRYWPSTVIFVIEDDPQNGGDHVDNHRAPLHVISPWVKRGHVSSVHYNESSIYRTIQLILGVDRPLNAYWENAAPMYDVFTSTPDYTPYTSIPRRWPEETNPEGTAFALQSASWDFSRPDEQPGIARALWEHLRGGPAPWSPALDLDDDDDRAPGSPRSP